MVAAVPDTVSAREINVHHIIIIVVCTTVLAASVLLQPNDIGLYLFGCKWPVHCLLNHLFGIKCALCGLTRSFSAMSKADFNNAFRLHHIGPVLYAYILLQIPYHAWAYKIAPKKLPSIIRKSASIVTVAIITAVLINWLFYLGGQIA
ncbi:MAG: DUF2752 domain-containing protein [Planctomycetota bacterium]